MTEPDRPDDADPAPELVPAVPDLDLGGLGGAGGAAGLDDPGLGGVGGLGGLDGLGGGGGFDMGSLLQSAMQMQQDLLAAQAQAAEAVLEGVSGGGAVRIEVTGGLEFRSVTIDPEVVDPDDVDLLQDLVLAALHDATARVQSLQAQAMPSLGGLGGLGGLDDLGDGGLDLGALFGGPDDDELDGDDDDDELDEDEDDDRGGTGSPAS